MPIEISDNGANNVVALQESPKLRGKITFRGSDNFISIGKTPYAGAITIDVHSNCKIVIGESAGFGVTKIHAARHCSVVIGYAWAVNGAVGLSLHEPSSISIGSRCLFADNVSITTSDMHAIFDLDSWLRINECADVEIGDRVWLGSGVLILKGTRIGNGAVVGARAVVTAAVPPCSIAAGNPARIVRTNVTWHKELRDEMPQDLRDAVEEWRKKT